MSLPEHNAPLILDFLLHRRKMDMDHSQVFSHERWRPITMALNLAAVVVLSAFVARRTPDSVARWRATSATELAVCLTLVVS